MYVDVNTFQHDCDHAIQDVCTIMIAVRTMMIATMPNMCGCCFPHITFSTLTVTTSDVSLAHT